MQSLRILFNLRKIFRSPSTPLWVKLVPLFGLAYLLLPVDVLPDPIPILGLLDDLVILVTLFSQAAKKVSKTPGILEPEIPKSFGYRP